MTIMIEMLLLTAVQSFSDDTPNYITISEFPLSIEYHTGSFCSLYAAVVNSCDFVAEHVQLQYKVFFAEMDATFEKYLLAPLTAQTGTLLRVFFK